MPTLQDALLYLGIDYGDDEMVEANVQRALDSAVKRLHGAVGEGVETYLPGDSRVEQLVLIYTQENYDAAGLSDKQINALRHLRQDLEPQLRLELRAAMDKAETGGEGQ